MPHGIGSYSFLVAFADQLERAITEDHGIDRVADAVESLASSLGMLLAGGIEDPGDSDGGDDESIDAINSPGDDTPLGAALRKIAELEQRAAATVGVAKRRLTGIDTAATEGAVGTRRKRRGAAVLKGGKRGSK